MLLTILAVVTLQAMAQDTLQTEQPEKKMSWLRRTIRGFSYIDENYVEPSRYGCLLSRTSRSVLILVGAGCLLVIPLT